MNRSRLSLIAAGAMVALWLGPISSARDLSYYLPPDVDYDPAIPIPSSVLGFQVGEWHVRHDQLASYMQRLAESSDRILIEEIGRTHEQRPLLHLTISSPENLSRLETIRRAHLELTDPTSDAVDTSQMPVVVNLGYSVHGNEASGSNASLLAAYYLAAVLGDDIEKLLSESIIILDPSLNPDGLSRFAQWANMHRGQVLVADPDHREHREGWPNGRTNHYWFDLNRDWLLAQHPESKARLAQFHRWRPNILIDAHEMGSDSTYFFQPGVPSRKNPLTPERNVALTADIARYHASALDEIGSLYYTEETFDDFYYGKGSTYPDIHGAVGILFEQASARGHLHETPQGDRSFAFAIRNQLLTTFSTLRAAIDKRLELLEFQQNFYRSAMQSAAKDEIAGYVIGDAGDPARFRHLQELLLRHQIAGHPLKETLVLNGTRYEPSRAFVVPTRQAQYLLIRSLFEKRVDFADSTFYDVSTWNLPLAFNLPYAELSARNARPELFGPELTEVQPSVASHPATAPGAALAFEWDGYYAPRALHRFLAAGVKARVATKSFRSGSEEGGKTFAIGTILVPIGIQEQTSDELLQLAATVAEQDEIQVHAIDTGLTSGGADLGSPSHKPLSQPKIALMVGGEIGAYAAGEVWHLLDHRHRMPVTLLEQERLSNLNISNYTHLILVDGRYRKLPNGLGEKIYRWVRRGGVLIALQRATRWVDHQVVDGESSATHSDAANNKLEDEHAAHVRLPYDQYETRRAAQLISGAIFEVALDTSHPLAYGYRNPKLPVFRNHETFLSPEDDPYVTVAAYSPEPLLSGYISSENLNRLRGTSAITAKREGKGTIVRMADSPTFRAYWYGTEKLLMNAIFFGNIIQDTDRPPRSRDVED